MSRTRERITYANVMASIAVFIALGAGSFAVAALKKNSVKSKQIKNGQVKNQDIAANAVSADKLAPGAIGSQAIANGSINGAQIADNSITGNDVDEASLEGVNAATVAGLRVEKVSFQVPLGSGNPILILGGLRLDAACVAFGDNLDINATTSKNDSQISLTSMANRNADDAENPAVRDIDSDGDPNFDVGDTLQVDNSLPDSVRPGAEDLSANFTINYSAPDGSVVVANLYAHESTEDCEVTGIAIGA